MLTFVKDEWVGWVYKGRSAKAPRLVSHDAWRSELQTTESPFALHIINDLPYTQHVHRSGQSAIEYVVVANRMREEGGPLERMRADLLTELKKAIGTGGKKKKIAGTRTGKTTVRARTA